MCAKAASLALDGKLQAFHWGLISQRTKSVHVSFAEQPNEITAAHAPRHDTEHFSQAVFRSLFRARCSVPDAQLAHPL